MSLLLTVAATFATQPALAEPQAPAADSAARRGLAFLAKDAVAWKTEHGCVSCHHAGMVVWAMREAKGHGYAIDEPLLTELTKWIGESGGDGTTSVARPANRPKALSAKAVWLALALGADPTPDELAQAALNRLLKTVRTEQTEDGSWHAWPETRPPTFGDSDEAMTALATLATLSAPRAGKADAAAMTARDNGLRWLDGKKIDDKETQPLAIRLVLWTKLDRPEEQRRSLAEQLRKRQNPDGGWSQTPDMPSDAWATGEALYALSHTHPAPNDPALSRARAFLTRAQRDDGSWPMTSRSSKPGDTGAKNLIPITGAGSAWAVIGLVRTAAPAVK